MYVLVYRGQRSTLNVVLQELPALVLPFPGVSYWDLWFIDLAGLAGQEASRTLSFCLPTLSKRGALSCLLFTKGVGIELTVSTLLT